MKIDKLGDRITTPEVDSITDAEEELHQATVLIQSIIRGRATQKLVTDTSFTFSLFKVKFRRYTMVENNVTNLYKN